MSEVETCPESVVVVPFPELNVIVSEFRTRYDPSAPAGMPPHVTLIYPFLEPAALTELVLRELSLVLSKTRMFECVFTRIREFDPGIVYLEPDAEQPFIEMITALNDRFGVRPYGGAYAKVTPHLTIGMIESPEERGLITAQLLPKFPQRTQATSAWLLIGNNSSKWKLVSETPFRD